ncbi:hypothetical protein ACFV9E_08995 [Streptomyces sp. NPDC059835]|uniref:hypothetical protein n=1 Tax=Streptomyces sp. NPDC059835 TaxID=3346967 RepID=UPI003654056D
MNRASFAHDEKSKAALEILTADGTTTSEVIRAALVKAAHAPVHTCPPPCMHDEDHGINAGQSPDTEKSSGHWKDYGVGAAAVFIPVIVVFCTLLVRF